MATEAQIDLYQALKAHQSDLEIQRDAAPVRGSPVAATRPSGQGVARSEIRTAASEWSARTAISGSRSMTVR
jgi:hypothetical protein